MFIIPLFFEHNLIIYSDFIIEDLRFLKDRTFIEDHELELLFFNQPRIITNLLTRSRVVEM
jgi:hypothetical protein